MELDFLAIPVALLEGRRPHLQESKPPFPKNLLKDLNLYTIQNVALLNPASVYPIVFIG